MKIPIPNLEELQKFFNQYKDIVYHREGGFKVVYKVMKGTKLEALKLAYIPKENITAEIQAEYRKRINREFELLRKCNSPFLVKLGSLTLSEVTISNESYVAYSEEFLEGPTLHELIKSNYKPEEAELKILAKCIIKAIKEIWSHGQSVHRDIKTQNIQKVIQEERPFVLFDLGIAFSKIETPLTLNPFNIPGTRQNIAPEMFDPNFRNDLDYRSDLYTLGITLYEYATGKHPFAKPGSDTMETISRIIRVIPEPIENLRPDLSLEFSELINQWLKKKPHLRPFKFEQLIPILESKP